MKTQTIQRLLEVSQSEAVNTPVMGTLVKDGLTLPNSVTEDVGGFSLMPTYSAKQLRRIDRKQRYKDRSLAKSARKELELMTRW